MIKEIIRETVASLVTHKFRFEFGDRFWQNLQSDNFALQKQKTENEPEDFIWLNSSLRGNVAIAKAPTKQVTYSVELGIGFKSKLDDKPEQKYDSEHTLFLNVQSEIIEKLIKDNRVQNVGEGVSGLNFQFEPNLFDSNYDCYIVTFSLKLKDFTTGRCSY